MQPNAWKKTGGVMGIDYLKMLEESSKVLFISGNYECYLTPSISLQGFSISEKGMSITCCD